ncbi:MAG: zinc ABC transporter substrate-binding protein [Candidatus Berkiella sp.]
MHWLFHRFPIALGFVSLIFCEVAFSKAPSVAVTLKPVHSLVASVMAGVAEPALLLPDGASPHTFSLKPSTLKTLKEADLIVWVGPSLETFMVKPLSSLNPAYGVIEIQSLQDLLKLPLREGREWQHSDPEDSHEHEHDHSHDGFDPHVWLSNANAQAIVKATEQRLSKHDPEHAKQYQSNAQKTLKQLQALKKTLQAELAPVQSEPFLVYHDGYQYFENDYDLKAVGTMVLNPHIPLSAHGLAQIKELINTHGIKCVFKETEFNEHVIQKSLGDLPIRIQELDPLGVHIQQGPQHYEKTLLQLGKTLQECLQGKIEEGSRKQGKP